MSTLTITGVQTQLFWESKNENLQMLRKKINTISQKTEIVVLPEMFSTGFSMNPELLAEKMDGPTMAWMKEMASEKKIILTGSIIAESEGLYYNRLIWMLPNGEYGYYDKRHLFAYAGEDQKYAVGNKRLIASVKGWKINLLICYDLRFPVWSRQTIPISENEGNRHPEFDILIYVASWPERRINAWKTLLQSRAIENQCYVVGVNRIGTDGNNISYTGDSMFVDPMGEILYHASGKEDIFTYAFEKEKLDSVRSKFPFWKDADHFIIEP
ncbi:MAG TPA: nitrilase family protein [Puia sp.]|nr:nitrilase family protein [Puia sp.]